MTAVAERTAIDPGEQVVADILREMVRGGIAGAIVGAIVAGVGGRVVMRLAALIVPAAVGRVTENGNLIGQITLAGSAALAVLGLVVGLIVGAIWVAASPWIPGTGIARALATMPVAVALGASGLIDGENPDFTVLQHAPVVVAMLLILVAAIGFAVPLIDAWLDRRLPGVDGASARPIVVYAVLAGIGTLVMMQFVFGSLFGGDRPRVVVGLAFVVMGIATIVWWRLRSLGETRPPRRLLLVGRGSLAAVVLLGTVDLAPEVSRALGA